ncbi:MAG: winged helix-turn-helix transcriptional regulator [Clostridia bacterium]|nr:winged helix-turn-helix transcriptional regulator [Clostridia bacterium]
MKKEISIRTVGVYTENEYLLQKIRLELLDRCEVVDLTVCERVCDAVLVDGDDPKFESNDGLKMRREGGDIRIPFRIGELADLISEKKEEYLEISRSQRAVRVGGKTVKLTELEYSLLSLLISARGNFVSRERILKEVWDGRADRGIINVYVHYLREKIEADGEKIILSSRNYGYKISEKYIGGKENA